MFPTASSPACARPARCTSATTTARSRTGSAAGRVVLLLRRRLACADDALRRARGDRSRASTTWSSTGSPPASIPTKATIFIQTRVPEHAELYAAGDVTPLGWLERVPTYKDQIEKLKDRDLATYGFLGYPLLQAADILIYRATLRAGGRGPGAARRDHARDRAPLQPPVRPRAGLRGKAQAAVKKLGTRRAKRYRELRTRFQEQGDDAARSKRAQTLSRRRSLSLGDRERSSATSRRAARRSWSSRRSLLTETSKVPGLDGQKMSKSYGNAIADARGAGGGRPRRSAACRPIRRACGAPTRATREVPGLAAAQGVLDDETQGLGGHGCTHAPASAASTASSR